ncbi:hypothetical protein D4Q85_00145 [bacterium]|nr:MAG: hypothetical protein D4Q85_00145 [bacterium]
MTMRIVVWPIEDPRCEIDVTDKFVAAIAEELWRAFGGNEQLNWIEAEFHVGQLFGDALLRKFKVTSAAARARALRRARGSRNATIEGRHAAPDAKSVVGVG